MTVSLPLIPVVVGYVIAAIAMASLTAFTVREMNGKPSLQTFAVLLALVTLWSAANAGRVLATTLDTKLLFHAVVYIGVAFTPVAWLFFALSYTGSDHYVRWYTVVGLSLPAVAAVVLAVTNPGGLYYNTVDTVTISGTRLIDLEAGPLYWVFTVYAYLLLTVGLGFLLRFAATSDRLYRVQSVSLSVATVLPLLLNVAFLAGFTPITSVDFTPITFALSALLIAVAVFYGDFGRMMPVAREAVIDTLDDGIVVTDEDDRITYTNPAANTVLASNQGIGTPLSETPLPNLDAQSARNSEFNLDTDGGTRWYLFRRVPFDQKRANRGSIYSFTDITERKELEEKLRQLQETSHELMVAESFPELGDIVVSAARDILALPVTGLWRYDQEADELQPVTMTAESKTIVDEQPTFRKGNSIAWQTFTENRLRVFDDVSAHEDVYSDDSPIKSEIQIPLGQHGLLTSGSTEKREFSDITLELLGVLANATELAFIQTDRERKLRRREIELERENERLDEFTSVVAHDLRSPLNSAEIFLDRMTDEYDDPRLQKVKSANDRTKELVDDLLALARQGKAVEEPAAVGVETVARRAWESVATAQATLDVVDDFEAILADGSRLRQVFENLFRNAVDHAGNTVAVRVGQLPEDDGFYVADDGPGIPTEERSQVFDHGYTQSADGTGFGLAIVRRIVEAHDWSVSAAESADGGLQIEVRGVEYPDSYGRL